MLSLAEQQLRLRAILRGDAVDVDADAWLRSVAESRGLTLTREIASWWQRFQIEWQCRYTSRLMKRLGCFEEYLEAHFAEHPAPPSIEQLSTGFLRSLRKHEDALVRAVASFELACIARASGQEGNVVIEWDRNPNEVMQALAGGERLPKAEDGARYLMRMGRNVPGGVTCIREGRRPAPTQNAGRDGASAGAAPGGRTGEAGQGQSGVRRAKIIEWPRKRG